MSRAGALLAALLAVMLVAVAAAPLLAPQDPFDAARLDVLNSLAPPAFLPGGEPGFPLGTDGQGRDVLSVILYGARLSFLVGALAVGLAVLIGVPAGLTAGYRGGALDAVLMRLADAQLAFPAILLALLLDGAARALLPRDRLEMLAVPVLVVAIGLGRWPQFARVVRGAARVAAGQDYVAAARLVGCPAWRILAGHVAPNAIGPALVLLPLNLGLAVLDEATLSFLGVGLPPTRPSLGTLIRIGNDYVLSGQWWVVVFPALALALPVLALNLLADGLRGGGAPPSSRHA
jgi:peptide/nickel transport system permease protein